MTTYRLIDSRLICKTEDVQLIKNLLDSRWNVDTTPYTSDRFAMIAHIKQREESDSVDEFRNISPFVTGTIIVEIKPENVWWHFIYQNQSMQVHTTPVGRWSL